MYKELRNENELWDLFTRKEEYFSKELDRFDRFNYVYSNNKNILEPKVSQFLKEKKFEIEYQDSKKFAVCLTHDVDEIYPPIKDKLLTAVYCMKHFDINLLDQHLFWNRRGRKFSPYRNFKQIIDLEEIYDAKSSFYFIATEKDIKRFRYNIEDLENEFGFIIDKDFEIGLHGGYFAYNNLEELINQKFRLEKVLGRRVIGFRNHYLRFKVPDTWELLAKAKFKYDTTLGYSDQVGFRNGICHPFNPFNLITDKEIDILEIPLNIMDGTLLNSNNTLENAWIIATKLVDTVEKYNGVLTLNWHNDYFNCVFTKDSAKFYEKLLNYCHKKKAWITSGEEIFKWWNINCASNYG